MKRSRRSFSRLLFDHYLVSGYWIMTDKVVVDYAF